MNNQNNLKGLFNSIGIKTELINRATENLPKVNQFTELVKYFDVKMTHPEHKENSYRLFEEYCSEAHPFVFLPYGETTAIENVEEELDLPFPVCHFEVMGGNISAPAKSEEKGQIDEVWVTSMSVREIAPKEYSFLAYCSFTKKHFPDNIMNSVVEVIKENDPVGWSAYNGFLLKFLERLAKEKIGVESKAGNKVRLGTGSRKFFWRPKPITHVRPKKYISEAIPVESGAIIDWSHRWEVRGHWRIVKGLGKDRAGVYCVNGFTWVSNHERGPEDKPLIKKTYVVG